MCYVSRYEKRLAATRYSMEYDPGIVVPWKDQFPVGSIDVCVLDNKIELVIARLATCDRREVLLRRESALY